MNGYHPHGRPGYGNSYDRRARREYLKTKFKDAKGVLRCFHCAKRLGKAWHVDRYPLCGHAGGTYARDNIVPSCAHCNTTRCSPGAGRCANHPPIPEDSCPLPF